MNATTTSTPCIRCGRALRSAKSRADGMGRTCKAKVAAAAKTIDLADFKPAQQAKAVELIEQGGIIRTSRPGIYTAVSSDGTTTYLVHRAACSCPAGLKGRFRCYHRLAVAIVQAAVPARRAA